MKYLVLLVGIFLCTPEISAQGPPPPPPPPPPPDPEWARTEGPHYISYRCEEGFVYVESITRSETTSKVWLVEEDILLNVARTDVSGVYVDGDYEVRSGGEVLHDGVFIRSECEQDRVAPVESVDGRPGVRLAWARMNPKPQTTRLQILGGGRFDSYWVGSDILTLDEESVASYEVDAVRSGYTVVNIVLSEQAHLVLAQAFVDHQRQPLAVLVDGVMVSAPRIQGGLVINVIQLAFPSDLFNVFEDAVK